MAGTATLNGAELAILIRQKIDEFEINLRGIDERRAESSPAGRWTPKQIVSHLCGPEGAGITRLVTAYLEQDTPRIDLVIEDPFYTGERPNLSLAELLETFEEEHDRLIAVVKGLTTEQLGRKAQIPIFKDTPLGEYPTLGEFLGGMADFHFGFHTVHLKEVLQDVA